MKILYIIAAIIALSVALFLMAPAPDTSRGNQGYPWNIQTTEDQSICVFGIELGHTPLQTFLQNVGESGETAIFRDKDSKLSLETYFSNLNLSGFEARIILRAAAQPSVLEAWIKQAGNGTPLPSGARKFLLNDEQFKAACQMPIAAITYVPRVAYDADTIKQRFGEPESRKPGPENSEYWFYPGKGLILVLNEKQREVLYFVSPADFDDVRQHLPQPPRD